MTRPPTGGRQDKGGGVTPAPLTPHPASQIFPSMSDSEFKDLCDDITTHGLLDDIMLLDGMILDGNNRYRACDVMHVEPRTKNWRGDDPIAYVISKNLHRRQLTNGQRAAAAIKAEHLYEADAKARMTQAEGQPRGVKASATANLQEETKGTAMSKAAKQIGVSERSAYDAKKILAHSPEVFKELEEGKTSVNAGLTKSGAMTRGTGTPRKPKAKPTPKEVPEHVAAAIRIRASDAETKYQSMLNAPAGKLNLPFLDRATKIQEALSEVTAITPEKAVSGIPALRCREYSVEMAEWWLKFVKLADARRQTETPELPTLHRRSRLAAVNAVAQIGNALSKEERHLQPGEKAVLDWLRQQSEPVNAVMVAISVRIKRSSASDILRVLCASNLAIEVGRVDRFLVYQAVKREE